MPGGEYLGHLGTQPILSPLTDLRTKRNGLHSSDFLPPYVPVGARLIPALPATLYARLENQENISSTEHMPRQAALQGFSRQDCRIDGGIVGAAPCGRPGRHVGLPRHRRIDCHGPQRLIVTLGIWNLPLPTLRGSQSVSVLR